MAKKPEINGDRAPSPREVRFRREIEDRLVPMLCAGKVGRFRVLEYTGSDVVQMDGEGRIVFRLNASSGLAFRLFREYEFQQAELELARSYARLCIDVCEHHDQSYFDELAIAIPPKAIGQSLGYKNSDLVARILNQFDELSNQTYERQRISAAIGLTNIERDSGVTLTEVWKEDFAKVLTSGIESMLVVDPEGRVFRHVTGDDNGDFPQCPSYLRLLAGWTTRLQLCIALNRNGEILILKDKRLEYARRRGRWLHFSHEAILPLIDKHCDKKRSARLSIAIHETCLDASFARSGACLAIVDKNKIRAFQAAGMVSDDDLLELSQSPKSKAVKWLTTKARDKATPHFDELERRFRQELAAIDGALVMDCEGRLLAVGAIVKVPGGSASGARRAAARALANFGLGIKVSADGEVSGFLADIKSEDGTIDESIIFKYG
jgi:hypothetical protein